MNILAISPHTDDAEMGAGGTMFKLVQEGHAVTHLALSTGMEGVGATEAEFKAAAVVLGAEPVLWDFKCRKFALKAHAIRHRFHAFVRGELSGIYLGPEPDLVLVPSSASAHEDHEVVTAEARRAFRTCNLIGYETPWSDLRPFKAQLFVPLDILHYTAKCQAIECYESQKESRHYFRPGLFGVNNYLRGLQIKTEIAEAFEVFRWIL